MTDFYFISSVEQIKENHFKSEANGNEAVCIATSGRAYKYVGEQTRPTGEVEILKAELTERVGNSVTYKKFLKAYNIEETSYRSFISSQGAKALTFTNVEVTVDSSTAVVSDVAIIETKNEEVIHELVDQTAKQWTMSEEQFHKLVEHISILTTKVDEVLEHLTKSDFDTQMSSMQDAISVLTTKVDNIEDKFAETNDKIQHVENATVADTTSHATLISKLLAVLKEDVDPDVVEEENIDDAFLNGITPVNSIIVPTIE